MNTGYADADIDSFIRSMSLYCSDSSSIKRSAKGVMSQVLADDHNKRMSHATVGVIRKKALIAQWP